MSFSIIGLATTIAVYREKRILIRIQSTPLKVRVFVAAQVLASLLLSIVQAAIILAVGMAIFSVSIPLSQAPQLCVLILMGNLVFLNLGFIVGAFSKTVAAASGLGERSLAAAHVPVRSLLPNRQPADGAAVRDRVPAAGSAAGDVQERRAGFRQVLGLPHAVRHSGRVDSAEHGSRHAHLPLPLTIEREEHRTLDAWEIADLLEQRAESGERYLDFFESADLSLGIYRLAAGKIDPASSHTRRTKSTILFVGAGR